MSAKGFICEADLNLHLLSTVGNHECPSQLVYLNIEIFGKVHKTKPQHAYYPLVFNETISVEKTFWSPASEDEVVDMLADSQVIIELRRIDSCFYDGLLLAYYDGTAKDLLFSRYPKIPCSTNGREIYLNRTVDFRGTAPRLRYSAFADVKRLGSGGGSSGGEFTEINSGKRSSMYNRTDDGYYSQSPALKDNISKPVTRHSRSPKKSHSPTINEKASSAYYTRQTVSSAIRSRSPSPIGNRSRDAYRDKEFLANGDTEIDGDKSKEPFVVRKVPDNLIRRDPKLHDNIPRDIPRRGRSRRRQSVTRTKTEPQSSQGVRFRSASLTRPLGRSLSHMNLSEKKEEKVESYRPSRFTSPVRSSYDMPHTCYDCHTRCHSPLFGHYSDRLARLSRGFGSSYCCHSHYCPYV